MVEELLLGDNPFIGVSHLAQEKARVEFFEASMENRVKVFEAAVEGGASGFTFSSHERNLEFLTHLATSNPRLLNEVNYYILVPHAESYVRRANVGGTPSLMKTTVRRMFRGPPEAFRMLSSIISMRPERLAGILIEEELAPYLHLLPEGRVKGVFLHEVVTDLVVAFNLSRVLPILDAYVEERLGLSFGLESRNFGRLCGYLSGVGYCPGYLMTPLNPLGYQMAPDKGAVEEAVEKFGGESKIVAINIMASGAVGLHESIEYLDERRGKIFGVTTASSKPHRIRENFQRLTQVFKSGR